MLIIHEVDKETFEKLSKETGSRYGNGDIPLNGKRYRSVSPKNEHPMILSRVDLLVVAAILGVLFYFAI